MKDIITRLSLTIQQFLNKAMRLRIAIYRFLATIFITAMAISSSQAKELNILTTITPIYSLVKNVTGDLQNIQLLIDKNMCPHEYQLRPSDVRKINNASIIITVGDGLETFLFKYLNKSHIKGKIIKLIDIKGLTILPLKNHTSHSHHNHDHHGHGHGHGHGHEHNHHQHNNIHDTDQIDWNFWPSPKNAKVIVKWIAAKLAKEDPANAKTYFKNAQVTISRLSGLDLKLRKKLALIKNKNFIVLNDDYQYIEQEYGLSNVGTMSIDKNFIGYSAKKIDSIRKTVKEKKANCIFVELHTPQKLVERIEHTTGAKVAYLDIEWGRYGKKTSDAEVYFAMMQKNADNILSCLTASSNEKY